MLLCYLLLKCWRTNFSSLTRLVCCTVKEKGQIQPGSWTQNKGRFPTLCTAANQPSPLRNRKLLKTEVLYSEVTDSWRSVGTVRPTMHVCTHTRLQVWAITFQLCILHSSLSWSPCKVQQTCYQLHCGQETSCLTDQGANTLTGSF